MKSRILLVALLWGAFAVPVFAAQEQQAPAQELPAVPLMDVLKAVSKKTGQLFAVDRRVDAEVVVGQLELGRLDYSTLLVVLRNNNMAAVKYDDVISIVNVATIRQYPLPVLYEKDESIDDEEWVTMVVEVQNAAATMFVPILRPMLPQPGHMVAHPDSNTLTIVDRYGNVERVLKLIRKLDYLTTQPKQPQ
jgi:general secretion pathway protein D